MSLRPKDTAKHSPVKHLSLPRYVVRIVRRGEAYYYLRRRGFPRVRLPGKPWSDGFMAAYHAVLAGRAPVGLIRHPGTVTPLALAYLDSPAFKRLAPSTRYVRRLLVERFIKEAGDCYVIGLDREIVMRFLNAMASQPGAARNWLAMIRALVALAIEQGIIRTDPTLGVPLPKLRKDSGFHTWTEAEIGAYRDRHELGTMPRLALELLLWTAQRRSDVVKLGPQHVRNGVIFVRQQKTSRPLEIPIFPELRAALDVMPCEHMTFLTLKGHAFKPGDFTGWFARQCRAAGLAPGCSAHGLRKAACRRLAEAGCSASVIASISGHKTLREVERYVRDADQAKMARMGMEAVALAFGGASRT